MLIHLTVDVEVERVEGKFESRDALAEQIVEAVEGADPGQIEGDNEGQYEVVTFEVAHVEPTKAAKR